jgi:hypothetical protein
MSRRSPTLQGFELMFRQPSLCLAEVAWRWSFGFAAVILSLLAVREYLNTLSVTNRDLLLLRTRQPTLVSEAIARIFHGSAPRAVIAFIVLAVGLALIWVWIASVGRTVTLRRILELFRDSSAQSGIRLGAMAELHFMRVAVSIGAVLAGIAAFLISARISTPQNPSPGSVVLIFFTLLFFIGAAWSFLNWVLSLSSIFVVTEGRNGFRAVSRAVSFLRDHSGAVLVTGTWFGLSHLTLFVVTSSMVAFPLAFAQILPPAMVLGGVLLILLLYFAAADFLYVGRLTSLVAILEAPPIIDLASVSPSPQPVLPSTREESGKVDQDELILGDRPE